MKFNRVLYNYIVLFFCFFMACQVIAESKDNNQKYKIVKIGVLAKRGAEKCLNKWTPTAEYLSKKLPNYKFKIIPLAFDEIYPAAEKKSVDFILANSSFYVGLDHLYGASRIATFKNMIRGKGYTKFGGVIFTRTSRKDINTLQDLHDKSFMAVKDTSFGGWQTAWYEMNNNDFFPKKDLKSLSFGGTHDKVVYAVQNGKVDAGTVRTETLERMASENKINLDDFKVIHYNKKLAKAYDFPFLLSTQLYPEWPIAQLKDTKNSLAEKVAVALINMDQGCEAAKIAMCTGWTIPLNYEKVKMCLRDLKVSPYEKYGEVTHMEAFRKYSTFIIIGSILFIIAIIVFIYVMNLNLRIKQSSKELTNIFNAAGDPMCLIDMSYKIKKINQPFVDHFDHHIDNIFGEMCNEMLNFTHCHTDECSLKQLMKNPMQKIEKDIKYINAEGKEHIYILTANAMTDKLGKVRGIIENFKDITERKKGENLIKKSQKETEEANKSLKITQEQLKESLEKAEEATRVKSAFLASMSHEIRTPLNGILGMAEILSDTNLNYDQKDCLNVICSSGDSLLSILNDILDYSKIESGKMELESLPFDLYQTIDNVLDIFRSKQKQGLDLLYFIEKDVPQFIRSDSVRIKQILINLIGNAFKFTERGEVFLNVSSLHQDSQQVELKFTIKDTGIGIPESKKDQIFQRFSQVDSSTSRKFGGTGLGLALCKRLTKLMGGDIKVDSEMNKGSCFSFYILTETCDDIMAETYIGAKVIPELEKSTAIIIDDNITNLNILERQCKKWGVTSYKFESPLEALESIKSGDKYDIGIVDMEMPIINGVEFIKQLKALKKEPKIPFILLSSSFAGDDLGKDRELFGKTILKPAKQSQLYCAIFELLYNAKNNIKSHLTAPVVTSNFNISLNASKYRILMAEDNAINRKLSVKVFEKLGLDLQMAENGLELLEILNIQSDRELKQIDSDIIARELQNMIIFMDCQMPVMDGYITTAAIRKWEDKVNATSSDKAEQVHVRIVAITANALQGDREKCLDAGMDDYVTKPFKIDDIKRAISFESS